MQFVLSTLMPKQVERGRGILSVDKNGDAMFFEGAGDKGAEVVASMKRCRLETATAHGIMLSGMELAGHDRSGRENFKYQEWWLRYIEV